MECGRGSAEVVGYFQALDIVADPVKFFLDGTGVKIYVRF